MVVVVVVLLLLLKLKLLPLPLPRLVYCWLDLVVLGGLLLKLCRLPCALYSNAVRGRGGG